MKTKDIIPGEKYAYFSSTYQAVPKKVVVIESGVDYHEAKGRGVLVKFPFGTWRGGERVVLGITIKMTWVDWLIEKEKEEARMLRVGATYEERVRMTGVIQDELDRLGILAKASCGHGEKIFVNFNIENADKVYSILRWAESTV